MEMQRGLSERDLQPWKISGHGPWREGGGKVEIDQGKILTWEKILTWGKLSLGGNFDLGKILTWGKINCGNL